ncbi:ArsR/SmtB family transcription factor [Streptomyces mirabilis]|uniref:ArsR/SmtB family transcription factor n=1 Tax=Streptomyces mirabilis TaxID=68239 RepID=UPI0036D0B989
MGATFVVSPLAQMGFLLNFGRTSADGGQGKERAAIRETLMRRDLQLLMAFRHEMRGYVPGFLFANGRPPSSLEAELHQVASAPSGVVARQMDRFLKRAGVEERPSSVETKSIMAALESGERSFAQRVAWELGQFWTGFMVARWSAMRALMEGDIRHRATSMAERGLSVTLNSLHASLSYGSGALNIQDERSCRLFESKRIVLHPSPMQTTWALRHDPWSEGGTHLAYPIGTSRLRRDPTDGGPTTVDPLGRVIGQARLLLLLDLGGSRTTTELAERHHMTASTVSYHLMRLHRVGLLDRTREGSKVYYQRTPEADRLVARHGRRTGAGASEGAVPVPRVPSGAVSIERCRSLGVSGAGVSGV